MTIVLVVGKLCVGAVFLKDKTRASLEIVGTERAGKIQEGIETACQAVQLVDGKQLQQASRILSISENPCGRLEIASFNIIRAGHHCHLLTTAHRKHRAMEASTMRDL